MATGRRIPMDTPEDLGGAFREQSVGRLYKWSSEVVRALKQLRDANDDGYPTPHAETHKLPPGTVDSIMSASLPGALLPGQPGSLGDPEEGAAAGTHTHDTTALAGSGGVTALTAIELEWLHWRV